MKGLVRFRNQRPNMFSIFDDMFYGNNEWSQLNKLSQPSVNIKESDENFVLELAAPGMKRKDFNIEVEHDQLILSTEMKDTKEEKGEDYSRREFNYSSFSRSFHIDNSIDVEGISAVYNEGILTVVLPKKEEVKKEARRIEIG